MKTKQRILLIEDNHAIAKQIVDFLQYQSWSIDYAANGKLGVKLALENSFDMIILDLNLPDVDGLQVCEQIKQQGKTNTPILMLTARDAYEDKVKGFGQGADDYLTKPFDLRELVLRCEALTRRPTLHQEYIINQGRLSLNTRSHEAVWNEHVITTTRIGFNILRKLIEEHPYPVSRSELIDCIWKDDPPESNALKSHIYTLRKACEKVTGKSILVTISNIGYKLQDIDV